VGALRLRSQARRLLAVPFVLEGIALLRDPLPRAKQLAPVVRGLAERWPSVPDAPESLARLQGVLGVTGGALLLAGRAPRTACALLAVQSVPTVLAGLREAREGDPADRGRRRSEVVKDLSLFGALVLSATEPKRRPSRPRCRASRTAGQLRTASSRPRRRSPVRIPRPRR